MPMDRPGLDERLTRLLVRVFQPVADVFTKGVVVTTVYLPETWPIQMDRDRGLIVPVSYPVDTPVTREHRGGAVLGSPGKVPRLFEAGMFEARSVVEPLVTLEPRTISSNTYHAQT